MSAEDRDDEQVQESDQPVHEKRIDQNEGDPDQGHKNDIDEAQDQLLAVEARFLEFLEQFTRPLVFKNGVRQRERMLDAVGIELGSHALSHDIFVILLEILRNARNGAP